MLQKESFVQNKQQEKAAVSKTENLLSPERVLQNPPAVFSLFEIDSFSFKLRVRAKLPSNVNSGFIFGWNKLRKIRHIVRSSYETAVCRSYLPKAAYAKFRNRPRWPHWEGLKKSHYWSNMCLRTKPVLQTKRLNFFRKMAELDTMRAEYRSSQPTNPNIIKKVRSRRQLKKDRFALMRLRKQFVPKFIAWEKTFRKNELDQTRYAILREQSEIRTERAAARQNKKDFERLRAEAISIRARFPKNLTRAKTVPTTVKTVQQTVALLPRKQTNISQKRMGSNLSSVSPYKRKQVFSGKENNVYADGKGKPDPSKYKKFKKFHKK